MARSYNKQTFEPVLRNWMSKLSTHPTYIRPKACILFQAAGELYPKFAFPHTVPTRTLLHVPFKNFQRPQMAFWKPPKTDAAPKRHSPIKAWRSYNLTLNPFSVPTYRLDTAKDCVGWGRERRYLSHTKDPEMARGKPTLSSPL